MSKECKECKEWKSLKMLCPGCHIDYLCRDKYDEVATILNNLAGLYETQGQYTQAEPLYKRSQTIMPIEKLARIPKESWNVKNKPLKFMEILKETLGIEKYSLYDQYISNLFDNLYSADLIDPEYEII